MKTANRIEMLKGGRFISHHADAEVYYDSRHKVIKSRMEGGGFFELIKEVQADGSYLPNVFQGQVRDAQSAPTQFVKISRRRPAAQSCNGQNSRLQTPKPFDHRFLLPLPFGLKGAP